MRVIVHLAALAVPAVVVPLGGGALSQPRQAKPALMAAALATPTFAFERGALAACWVVPWLAVAATIAARAGARLINGGGFTRSDVAMAAASLYLGVSATWLALSRLGSAVGPIHEPIVELTAVHYGFAGYGATVLALCAAEVAARSRRRVARTALVATITAPPIVALGFITGDAVPQVGGAMLLTVGVLSTAFLTVVDARRRGSRRATRVLLAVSAAAPVVPMALAVVWAAAQHWTLPALDIPAMARLHGSVNAIGFVACGLVGYRRLRVAEAMKVSTCS